MNTKNAYNAFIGSIPGTATKEALIRFLTQYTKVLKLDLACRVNSRGESYCLGFGHALFETDPGQAGLLNIDPPIIFQNRVLKIKRHLSGQDRKNYRNSMAERRLFILNIPKNSTNQELSNFFAKFGRVDSTSIIDKKPKDKSTHFGFVVFEHKEDAEALLNLKRQQLWFKNSILKLKPYTNGTSSVKLKSKKERKESKYVTKSKNKPRINDLQKIKKSNTFSKTYNYKEEPLRYPLPELGELNRKSTANTEQYYVYGVRQQKLASHNFSTKQLILEKSMVNNVDGNHDLTNLNLKKCMLSKTRAIISRKPVFL